MNKNIAVSAQDSMNAILSEVAGMLPGSECMGNGLAKIDRVQMDSRHVQSGDLFLALKGERFDAHDFLADIAKTPNVSVVVQKSFAPTIREYSLDAVCVEDTKEALGTFAKAWRVKHGVPLIGVTGSNGKTTVTQMIASILKAYAGENALATQGNLNNDIGLPQTLLRLRAHHTCAVVELGMNHPGEIEYLANLAQPSVGLINNAQREHQEFMSTVEAVAKENGQVIHALGSAGVAVFPADDEFTPLWTAMCGAKPYVTFSDVQASTAPVRLSSSSFKDGVWTIGVQTPAGPLETQLHIAGQHNVKNALAAIACCLAIQIPLPKIVQGLSEFRAVKGRSRPLQLNFRSNTDRVIKDSFVDVIDDTYNANPDSVIAAINVLAHMKKPTLLILGDMGEVGTQGPSYHKEVGEYAAQQGVNCVYALGELSRHTVDAFNQCALITTGSATKESATKGSTNTDTVGVHFPSMESLIENLTKAFSTTPAPFKSVLVKGSRFMRMEQSVQALEMLEDSLLQNNIVQVSAQNKESTCC